MVKSGSCGWFFLIKNFGVYDLRLGRVVSSHAKCRGIKRQNRVLAYVVGEIGKGRCNTKLHRRWR